MSASDLKNMNLPPKQRFKPYRTHRGYLVLPMHHTMVPEFDPARDGKEWYEAKKALFEIKRWNQEHDIDFSAVEGGLVYSSWNVRRNVLLDYIDLKEDWYYQCIIDPGVAVTAALWQAIVPRFINDDGQESGGWIFKFDEYYVGDSVPDSEHLSATRHAEAIMRITQIHCDRILGTTKGGGSRKGGQSWLDVTIMDPSAWRREGSAEDKGSVSKRYYEAGMLSLMRANTSDVDGGIERVKQLDEPNITMLHPNGLIDVDGVGFPISWVFPHLGHYIKEKLAYKRTKDGTKVVKKHDHLMDCERMGAVYASEIHEEKKPVEFSMAYKKLMKAKNVPNKGGYAGVGRYENRNRIY